MAVKIRLLRMGKIRNPQYRIVVADSRTKRDGRAIEHIGIYQPKEDPSVIVVKSERVQHWLSVGAQPSEPVQRILELTGDWQKFKGLPAPPPLLVAPARANRREVYEAEAKAAMGLVEEKKAAPKAEPRKAKAEAAKVDQAVVVEAAKVDQAVVVEAAKVDQAVAVEAAKVDQAVVVEAAKVDQAVAVEETTPVVEETQPAVEETQPAVEETQPVVEETQPVVEETQPAATEEQTGADTGETA